MARGRPRRPSSTPAVVANSAVLRRHSQATAGRIGMAQEYFHVNYVAALAREYGLASQVITGGYIDEVTRRTRSEGRIFSSKLHRLQINQLVDALRVIHPDLAAAQ